MPWAGMQWPFRPKTVNPNDADAEDEMRWNNYREDEVGSGCLSLVCGIMAVGTLLLWVTGLINLDPLFSAKSILGLSGRLCFLIVFFPVGGIATGIYALETEERPFAIAGIFLSVVVLSLFVLAFIWSAMFF